jgi:hypothetical protein
MGQLDLDTLMRNTNPVYVEGTVISRTEKPLPEAECRDREPEGEQLPAGPLRLLDKTALTSRKDIQEQLTKTLPLNDLNMPIFIYRTDMIDPLTFEPMVAGNMSAEQIRGITNMLNAATIRLDYSESYPILPSGSPLWERLPFETEQEFAVFKEYLSQDGTRQASAISSVHPDVIKEYFHCNYWLTRANAWDLFRVANHQRKKLQRQTQLEEDHNAIAERLLNKLRPAIEAIEIEEFKGSPEKLIKSISEVTKIQRIANGLPANGTSEVDTQVKRADSLEVIMEQVVDKSGGRRKSIGQDAVDELIDDPDAIDDMQRMIVRFQRGK